MRLAALFARPLLAGSAEAFTAAGNGAALLPRPLPMPIDGARPVRPLDRVEVAPGQVVRGADKSEIFTLAPRDGEPPSGLLGVIVGFDRNDGLDLSRLGRFAVLETAKVDNVYADLPIRIAPLAGRKLSLDLDADGKADAHLMVAGDGFLPTAIKDLPSLPGPPPRLLPAEPPGGWNVNMPMRPGGPIAGTVRPIEGEAGEGEFHILPYPMPDAGPGEVSILPFPLPGAPASFASWGSWIGF